MTRQEHILQVLSEEATEILENIFEKEDISMECADLMGVADLINEEGIILMDTSIELESDINLIKLLLNLQYFVSKGLRFGLDDVHPKLFKRNRISIVETLQMILFTSLRYNDVSPSIIFSQELREAKKAKVLKYLEFNNVETAPITKDPE